LGYDLYKTGKISHPWILNAARSFSTSPPKDIKDVAALVNGLFRRLEDTGLYFRFNQENWATVLHIAFDRGWRQEDMDFDYYLSNQGNLVSKKEAKALAEALEDALRDYEQDKKLTIYDSDAATLEAEIDIDGRLQDKLIRFIEFCRGGEFEIH
jgi:hypothetical protein